MSQINLSTPLNRIYAAKERFLSTTFANARKICQDEGISPDEIDLGYAQAISQRTYETERDYRGDPSYGGWEGR